MALLKSTNLKEELNNANFALVLDYVKMKNMMSIGSASGDITDTAITKAKRQESREGALALKLPNDIKDANFNRYIKQISQNIKITDDISSLRRIFQRVFGFGYAGHYILQGLNFSAMEEIFDSIVNSMTSDSYDKQSYVDRAARYVKERMEANIEYNNNVLDWDIIENTNLAVTKITNTNYYFEIPHILKDMEFWVNNVRRITLNDYLVPEESYVINKTSILFKNSSFLNKLVGSSVYGVFDFDLYFFLRNIRNKF
jgi:hypothetical protein